MTARRPRVLMVGTALDGRGGVAAVVGVLRGQGLFEREGVRYIATHRAGLRRDKLRGALDGVWQVVRACIVRRPAIVHVHAASRASFMRKSIVLLIARRAGCKTIFHLHGGAFRQFATREAGVVLRGWIRHTLQASSVVIALSEGWAQFVHEFAPGAKVAVVPNSVPLPALGPALDLPSARLLFFGRLEAAKGVFDLLDAGAALVPMFPALRLVFGGEGDAAALLAHAAALGIADRVELLGWVDGARRDAEFARAAVFCLPSHAEGLPMALLEAMAARVAVVATRVGAIPETVHDGDNGLLVPAHDSAALAGALAQMLGDAALRAHLAARGRATIERHYATETVCGQLSAIYRELAGARE